MAVLRGEIIESNGAMSMFSMIKCAIIVKTYPDNVQRLKRSPEVDSNDRGVTI